MKVSTVKVGIQPKRWQDYAIIRLDRLYDAGIEYPMQSFMTSQNKYVIIQDPCTATNRLPRITLDILERFYSI